jgi:hypothetical protein
MNFPRLHFVLLDHPGPFELAKFYSALTGIAVETRPGYAPEELTDIDLVHDFLPALSFQRVQNYVMGMYRNRCISIVKLMTSTRESVTSSAWVGERPSTNLGRLSECSWTLLVTRSV